MDIGTRIKQARQAKGISQRELARRIGKDAAALSRIESVDSNPQWVTLMAIAEGLEIPVEELVAGEAVMDVAA